METSYRFAIKTLPASERPREKLIKEGVHHLSNPELIGIVLSSGTHNASAIDLGRAILACNNEGLSDLRGMTVEELCKINGVGPAKACQLMAAVELGRRISLTDRKHRYKIHNPEDISRLLMDDMRFQKKEIFSILLLNTKHEVLGIEQISVGSLNASIVHPREVFVAAIKKSCSAIVLAHNHPSGDPAPSKEDIQITKRLIEAGSIIGIRVLDHVIIGDNAYTSLREQQCCDF